MRGVLAIAGYVARRSAPGAVGFGALLGLALAVLGLGTRTVDAGDTGRVVVSYLLGAGQLVAVGAAALSGAFALPRELRSGAAEIVMARPVRRPLYLIGTWLGASVTALLAVSASVGCGLSVLALGRGADAVATIAPAPALPAVAVDVPGGDGGLAAAPAAFGLGQLPARDVLAPDPAAGDRNDHDHRAHAPSRTFARDALWTFTDVDLPPRGAPPLKLRIEPSTVLVHGLPGRATLTVVTVLHPPGRSVRAREREGAARDREGETVTEHAVEVAFRQAAEIELVRGERDRVDVSVLIQVEDEGAFLSFRGDPTASGVGPGTLAITAPPRGVLLPLLRALLGLGLVGGLVAAVAVLGTVFLSEVPALCWAIATALLGRLGHLLRGFSQSFTAADDHSHAGVQDIPTDAPPGWVEAVQPILDGIARVVPDLRAVDLGESLARGYVPPFDLWRSLEPLVPIAVVLLVAALLFQLREIGRR